MKTKYKKLADMIKATRPAWRANGDDVPALMQWQRMANATADWLAAEAWPEVDRGTWLDYVMGHAGPNGGKI